MPLTASFPQFEDTPDNIAVFNADYLETVPDQIHRLHCNRVFLLTSSTLNSTTNCIDKLEMILGNGVVAKKVGVKPHTPYTDVLDLVHQLHESRADTIVSIGSSSYTDAAKIAMIVHSSLKPSDLNIAAMDTLVIKTNNSGDIVYPPNLKPPVLKLIVIPTTLSAAEYNTASGATHPATHKKAGFAHPLCAPKCIILDPGLCTTTPQRLWLSTGMRAVDHCVEALCTDLCTPKVAQSADEGLRCLVSGLLACRADATSNDTDAAVGVAARSTCHFGAWKAMQAGHCKVPFGASHAIGHQLGSVAGVPHGETSCVMLPAVMKYNKGANSARQERVTDILWSVAGEVFAGVGLSRDAADAGDLIKALVRTLGLPTTLGEVGVSEDAQLDRIAEHTLADMWGRTNPRRLDNKEQVREILRMAS